ncbi:MAG: TolC family protein [Bacteroidales bacterium]|nr:TolC family protein [Bacteroidales bacterium]
MKREQKLRLLSTVMTVVLAIPLWAQENASPQKVEQTSQIQQVLTLDDCHKMAIENNKNLKVSEEKINMAVYEKRAAVSNYLPKISATGAYMHTMRTPQLLPDSKLNTLTGIGTGLESIGQILQLEGITHIGDILTDLADRLQPDLSNVYVGMISAQEPLYVGGKIRAYNRIAAYAKELAQTQYDTQRQEIIVQTDQAYWQIVSIANKVKLTESYVELLRKLNDDVDKLVNEGLATQSDKLSIQVKLNEAEMMLIKAQNGLVLAKMLLCQYCGMDLESNIVLEDETLEDVVVIEEDLTYTKEEIIENRPELHSLDLATKMYDKKVRIVASDFLPTIALFGNYIISNPSIYNGFEKQFNGNLSFGVMAKIPLFHWGEGMNKIRMAKAEAKIAKYELEDKTELIMLQAKQFHQRIIEADSRLKMSQDKMNDAEENLRKATIGFREGMVASTVVTQAQTAWLQAHSEYIDSKVDRIMTAIYLKKATGKLNQ